MSKSGKCLDHYPTENQLGEPCFKKLSNYCQSISLRNAEERYSVEDTDYKRISVGLPLTRQDCLTSS